MKVYHIRALSRGMRILELLAVSQGLTISAIARALAYPQPTVSRVIKTLQESGYVIANAANKTFHVASKVGRLGRAVTVDPWVSKVSGPAADRLCREIAWPVFIATMREFETQVIWSTAPLSPVAAARFSAGMQLQTLASASGLMLLSQLKGQELEHAISACCTADPAAVRQFGSRSGLRAYLKSIAKADYHIYPSNDAAAHVWLALPIARPAATPAVITIAFHNAAYSEQKIISDYLPKLRSTAESIVAEALC